MSVRYLKIEVEVSNLDIKDEVWTGFLVGWVKECIKACIYGKNSTGENRMDLYNFKGDPNKDIKAKLIERAGEYEIVNTDKDE